MRRRLAALVLLWLCRAPAAAAAAPNVVLIVADDLGWRDSSVYGSTLYETPSLERLAERGMVFRNAYAASPLCSPTRASILTGLYPGRLRLTMPAGHLEREVLDPGLLDAAAPDRRALTPETRTRLPNDYRTIAETLREAGYATAFFGKWHLGRAPYLPQHQGFDVVVGGSHHPAPPGGYFSPWSIDTIPQPRPGEHISHRLATEAARFIRANRDRPFFVSFWDYSVHAPFDARRALVRKYRGRIDPDDLQRSPLMAAMIETMDTAIGTLLDTIDEQGLAGNTIVIFTSDNGGNTFGSAGGEHPTSNAPLRSGKGSIYEGGVRVPLIVVWPGMVSGGTESEAVVTSVDHYPTILDMLGLDAAAAGPIDGVSIVPALDRSAPLAREAIFCHFPHYVRATHNVPGTSIRFGDWKLIRFHADGEDQTDRFELYDLRNDLAEAHDLAPQRPDLVADLDALIARHLEDTDALVPVPNPEYDREAHLLGGWTASRGAVAIVDDGFLRVAADSGEPAIVNRDPPRLSRPAALELRMRADAAGTWHVRWTTKSGRELHPRQSTTFSVPEGGSFRRYRIPLPIDRRLVSLRLDPGTGTRTIEIESIRLTRRGEVLGEWTFAGAESVRILHEDDYSWDRM
jgi:arylsulfatase A-like enzyme